ncbi:MAG: hypothetical protein IT435_00665 [Phycisphaerales bacterium]|nr:hypothetical protein [Phycisphaerales bacterium]
MRDQHRTPAGHDAPPEIRAMTDSSTNPAPTPPTAPPAVPDLTDLDRTRDLALTHLIERLADGEVRPEDLAEVERQVHEMPAGSARIATERTLRDACRRVMGDVPIPEGMANRVREAARLRLRGEQEGIHLVMESMASAGPVGQIQPTRRRFAFIRLAAAAALVLAGFIGARMTRDTSTGPADIDMSARSETAGFDLSSKSLRDEYYSAAIAEATRVLGEAPTLPEGDEIRVSRYSPAVTETGQGSVRFEYVVKVAYAKAATRGHMVSVVIQLAGPDAKFDPSVVLENDDGDVFWRIRQSGRLIYHIQSDSKQALHLVSERLGWPAPATRAPDR